MTCDEAREQIGADPETASAQLLAHLESCPQCQAYRNEMLALNAKIRRAFEIDLQPAQRVAPPGAPPGPPTSATPTSPPAAATPTPPTAVSAADRSNVAIFARRPEAPASAKRTRSRGLPIAASLAAGVLICLTLWLSRPTESLAGEVITHVEGEPDSWSKTEPVTAERLDAVLRKSGVKLGPGMQPVVYANSCFFRGHFVPHFVVMTQSGPVTVMILLNEHVKAAQQFKEDGYSGLLVPARNGSVAVVSRTPMALEQPADDVVHALQSN
jgi:hypothetical protein